MSFVKVTNEKPDFEWKCKAAAGAISVYFIMKEIKSKVVRHNSSQSYWSLLSCQQQSHMETATGIDLGPT